MIDSSKWEVSSRIVQRLKQSDRQKSISLKDGEENSFGRAGWFANTAPPPS